MQSRSQETHDHILVSAGRLFSEKGYADTSVSEICEFAGVSKGAFYYHFPTKQALFIAFIADLA
jgi:AcrR family transcriptional regulator